MKRPDIKSANSAAAIIALGLLSLARPAIAQSQSLTGNASATVQNSLTATEMTPPSTGSVVLIADTIGVDTATVTVTTAGVVIVTPNGSANAIVVDDAPANAAQFMVSNAAPNTELTLTFNSIVNLNCGLCTASNPDIILSGLNHDAGAMPMTDAGGNLSFNVGFTLTTVAGGGNQYEDGIYNGSFNVNISY
jgi:hypothetical protein